MTPETRQTLTTILQTQWWKRQINIAWATEALEHLVRHARRHVPFYRDNGRLDRVFDSEDRFVMANWRRIPVLSRAEAYIHADSLRAETLAESIHPLEGVLTRGATGPALEIILSRRAQVMSDAQVLRAASWHGFDWTYPSARSQIYDDARMQDGFTKAGNPLAAPEDAAFGVDVDISPEKQIEVLRIGRPHIIITWPSLVLAWIACDGGESLRPTHSLILSGETLTPEIRARIAGAYTGRIIDVYATAETGPIAAQSPDGLMKVCEENVWLEDPVSNFDRDRPKPIVVTPLHGHAMPLIRYAPGDVAIFDGVRDPETPSLRCLRSIARANG